ncbi:MAG: 3-methyl-2-oxobutanoate dehydrogenase subunit VorB [Clostridiales bacterium]|jgi:2-oxoglutarate ferredoxin oxidoreductase subunit alpha|nr:3-methyl-2-oxobutanoate dehydrogenase subunit VorB [Clostridiales bacterium]
MEKVLMKGNEAIAEAAIMAGCRHFFGYPITPQTEVAAYMSKRLPQVGGVYLQAESEIASINMVLGASSAGVRVLTSSSSPGISLMSEGLSYIAGCDLPAVLVNIQRGGPGLGGIQPSQADYYQATRSSGHGDFRILVLAPNSVQEMADLTMKAFDLADKHRMPAMILGDGILGQMMEPIVLSAPEEQKPAEKPWAATGTGGTRKKNIINSLYLQPDQLERKNLERYERYKAISESEAMYEEHLMDDADVVLVAYGATSRICKNAISMARSKGIKAGLIRPVTLWPFPEKALANASCRAKSFVCVEMSMGQMIDDVKLAVKCSKPVYFCGRTGGMVHSPEEILKKIEDANGGVINEHCI